MAPITASASQCLYRLNSNNLDTISIALKFYKEDCGEYPEYLAYLTDKNATKCDDPNGYLAQVPRDVWGNEFHYESSLNSFILYSYGDDGIPSTSDDFYEVSDSQISVECREEYLRYNMQYIILVPASFICLLLLLFWGFYKLVSSKNT